METSNQVKARLLGEPFGTATSRLRKMLLFDYVKRCNNDICYRCGTKIETLEEFSIEHTRPWQRADDPKEMFFDLTYIAFSHLSCNSSAPRPKSRNYIVGMKWCRLCKLYKGETNFYKGQNVCKICSIARVDQYRRKTGRRPENKKFSKL
jgi:hypothetical protein